MCGGHRLRGNLPLMPLHSRPTARRKAVTGRRGSPGGGFRWRHSCSSMANREKAVIRVSCLVTRTPACRRQALRFPMWEEMQARISASQFSCQAGRGGNKRLKGFNTKAKGKFFLRICFAHLGNLPHCADNRSRPSPPPEGFEFPSGNQRRQRSRVSKILFTRGVRRVRL